MKEIIMEMFSSFWKFIGGLIVLYVILYFIANFLLQAFNRLLRVINMRKNGYPPAHCDADGDFLNEAKRTVGK